MNHLAHLLLADEDNGLLAGSILGDHVKGRLHGERPAAIERGIQLHRAIDAFTDTNPIAIESRTRFEPRFRRVGGIMTDIIFDHFLARQFSQWHATSLERFSDRAMERVLASREHLPKDAIQQCERMQANRSLTRYADPVFVDRSFSYLSTRLRGDNPLVDAYAQFVVYEDELAEDFVKFFPELMTFAEHWKKENTE